MPTPREGNVPRYGRGYSSRYATVCRIRAGEEQRAAHQAPGPQP
jgi:hypothetical protein